MSHLGYQNTQKPKLKKKKERKEAAAGEREQVLLSLRAEGCALANPSQRRVEGSLGSVRHPLCRQRQVSAFGEPRAGEPRATALGLRPRPSVKLGTLMHVCAWRCRHS